MMARSDVVILRPLLQPPLPNFIPVTMGLERGVWQVILWPLCSYSTAVACDPEVFHLYQFFFQQLWYHTLNLQTQPTAPLVLIIKSPLLPSSPHTRAQVRRGSALITILSFTLKEHLKRLWWEPEKSTWLQKHWEEARQAAHGYLSTTPCTNVLPPLLKSPWNLFSHCCTVCSTKLILIITTLGLRFSSGLPKRAT